MTEMNSSNVRGENNKTTQNMMQPTVQVLDTITANQIAAGEVVEKPASVVKELVENALDAGATKITVTVYAGGTEYIRVEDNGCGMSEENARRCILRHATSKLVKADDLLRLHTLGFRGEALPSIASVSHFTLLTRPADAEFATSIRIDGGENPDVSSMGGSAGTTVIVEDLFYNVPARRKFLKTTATEGRYINELLTKLALSRPDVRFKLVSNDKEVISTPGDGDLKNAVRSLYGKNVAGELLDVHLADPKIKIEGYISRPTLLKGTRGWQTFFVNGRSIGSKMLSKAMDHAYQSQIPKSGFPFAVLNITLDTSAVDVNVHPQKSEIKFSDESLVYKAMFKALTDALTRPMAAQRAQTQMTLLADSELNAYVKNTGITENDIAQGGKQLHGTLVTSAASGVKPFTTGVQSALGNASAGADPARQRDLNQIFKVTGDIFKTPDPDKLRNEQTTAQADAQNEVLQHDQAATSEGFMQPQAAYETQAAPKAEQQSMFAPFSDFVTAESVSGADTAQAGAEAPATYGAGHRDTVIQVHEARQETAYGAQHASVVTQEGHVSVSKQEAARPTIAFTDTDSGVATIWPIGQVDKTFIIAQSEDTLYLIDQHAAHERILYDKLCASHENMPAQQLLMPLYINMDADSIALLEEHRDVFSKLGVDASAGGETMLRVESLPVDIKAEDAEGFIEEICTYLREHRTDLNGSDLRQEVLHMTACRAAIKAGQLLTLTQMRQLIIALCNTTHPFTCPHGRPCMIAIDSDDLYKMFKRTGF